MRKMLLTCVCGLLLYFVQAQTPAPVKANYSLAARFSPQRMAKVLFSTRVEPHWLKLSNRFWYDYETTEGRQWYIVNPADPKGGRKPMWDNATLAAAITRIVKDPFDAQHLPISSLRFTADEQSVQFAIKSTLDVEKKKDSTDTKKKTPGRPEKKIFYFEYNLSTGDLQELTGYEKPKEKPRWANISPDSQVVIFARHDNLYWMDKSNYLKALEDDEDSTIVEHALTADGIEFFSYAGDENDDNVEKEKNKDKRKRASIYWSPDSRYFTMIRSDKRKVKDLWVINSLADPRPTLETYKYQMPGEKEMPEEYLLLFDLKNKIRKEINVNFFKDQDLSVWSSPNKKSTQDDQWRPVVWLGTNDHFYLSRTSRDLKRIDLLKVNVKDSSVQIVEKERLNTYVEMRRPGLINGGKEMVVWSERDGWGHFYLYDDAGNMKQQLTSGAYHCEDIIGIDEANRVLYFSANGRERGEDPYYLHMYRVGLDGTGLQLLNPGEYEHDMDMDDQHRYFVDNYSRVNTVPESVVYGADGRFIMSLQKADFSSLFATGYKFPEIFKVKADDGITDLYGVLYKPFDFDSTRHYPIVAYVYPGPQTEAVNKAFSRVSDRTDRLAQLGMIVVTVGNRGGNPNRSKWYHNYGYGNLRDYGLADKKTTIEQLAMRYAFIDEDKVGIYGHSGGGFMSTAAMLVYPDFFKVAVSSSGNHDNSIYNRWWSEKHHGVKETITDKGDTTFVYNIEKNPDIASHLKGHLLLTTGDMDNNVHPANTIRMANALIKAHKRFDFLLLPGQRHGYSNMQEYFFWVMCDYFSKWLLGDFSQPVDMIEIDRDLELTK